MTKTKPIHATREGWLNEATRLCRALFKEAGYDMPEKLHVSCGWPSNRGTATKNYAIGECWPEHASADKVCQIFISPRVQDPIEVGAILVHEIVHAVVGLKEKHNKVFKKCALAVGLEGKMTATGPGEELTANLKVLSDKLGTYPHPQLKPGFRLGKKQTTRLVKCECKCGYNVRVTRKWLEIGAPLCPCNNKPMTFDLPAELEGDDE